MKYEVEYCANKGERVLPRPFYPNWFFLAAQLETDTISPRLTRMLHSNTLTSTKILVQLIQLIRKLNKPMADQERSELSERLAKTVEFIKSLVEMKSWSTCLQSESQVHIAISCTNNWNDEIVDRQRERGQWRCQVETTNWEQLLFYLFKNQRGKGKQTFRSLANN